MNSIRTFTTLTILFTVVLAACEKTETETPVTESESARPAKIVSVLADGISVLRTFPGMLEATKKAELAFRVGGQLIELPAQAGLEVKQGDLLARLDDSDYRNTLEERQARYDLAKIQHEQARKLLAKKLTSQLQYDQTTAELKSARAALEQARDNLEYTRLLAPFEGIVARVDVENHQAIQAKSPVIELQVDDQLDVRFSVPESLITQLKIVDDPSVIENVCGIVRFSTHPDRSFQACHKEHETVPDPLTRNYNAVFTLEKITDFTILPGMSASIELNFSAFLPDDAKNELLVPVEAVFEKEGGKWVWRVDDEMRARRVAVEVGRFNAGMIEITDGLKADNRIIAAGVSYVREGMLVRPIVKERGL